MRNIIGTLLIGASALAFCGGASAGNKDKTVGAKEYAPGQVKPDSSSAKTYAPGQVKGDDESAKAYAPGQSATDGAGEGARGQDKSTGSSDPHGSKQ
jgi:hypothetical protein